MSALTVTLIQTDIHWENPDENRKMISRKIDAIQEKTEIVVLPEMFTTGFSMKPEKFAESMQGETLRWMKEVATRNNIILTGSLMIKENGNFYNRLIWMQPNGSIGFYDKRHLFAYANEDQYFTSGNNRFIASVKGWKINLLICYDLRFPVWSRQSGNLGSKPEYDVLLYVANWPEKRSLAWKTLLQARAIENQSYCIGVNRIGTDATHIHYNGDSSIINPLGEIIYQNSSTEDTHTLTLEKNILEKIRNDMPFWKDADAFKLLQ